METPLGIEVMFIGAAGKGYLPVLQSAYDLVETFANGDGPGQIPYAKLRSPHGYNALHMAAMSGRTAVCRFLIEKLNFDINAATDEDGDTPLLGAIHERQWPATIFLIDSGADVTIPNLSGETPLHIAAMTGSKEMIKLLFSKGADPNAIACIGMPLHYAAQYGNHGALECLLDLKADPNPTITSLEMTPLFLSLYAKSIECMELLLKAGADPNQPCYGRTPLCYAASKLDEGIIRCLLEAGANPDLQDSVSATPLEHAALVCRPEVVELLFPVTSRIACYPDWSSSGVMHHVQSLEESVRFLSILKEVALIGKAKGGEAFERKHYLDALNWYTQAVEADPDAKAFSNRSLCYTKTKNGREALADAMNCIRLEPGWAKGHYREGAAWNVLKDFKKATEAFSRALALDPRNKEIQQAYRAAKAEFNEDSRENVN